MAARTKLTKGQIQGSPSKVKQTIDSIQATLDGLDRDTLSMKHKGFTGRNGAGAITVTGLAVGDRVCGVANCTDGSDGSSSFEGTVTVANQIQQSSASDLSSKKFSILVIKPVS